MDDPDDEHAIEEVRQLVGLEILPRLAAGGLSIEDAIDRVYG